MRAAAVVISDLHLGAPNSILNLMEWPQSEVGFCKHGEAARSVLIEGVREQLNGDDRIDRLVLNGDVIDLSHGSIKDGIRELGTFLRSFRDAFDIGECVLVIGNHDRQWWEWQCQYEGVIQHLVADQEESAESFYRRTTDTSGRSDAPVILNPLHEHVDFTLRVAYPDYQFVAGNSLIRCHHGHLFEDLYSVVYSALLQVLADYEDPDLRDRPLGNPIVGEEVKQIKKSGNHFAPVIRRTLGITSASARGDLEMLERVCAPFINLDWHLLGQNGLLRKSNEGDYLARAIFEWTSRKDPWKPDRVGQERKPMKNAYEMFLVLFGLGIADFYSAVPGGGERHPFSSGGIKNWIDKILALVAHEGPEVDRPDINDPTSMSRHRLRKLESLAPSIRRHAARFYSTIPHTYIVSHTHVPGDMIIEVPRDGAIAAMRTVNTGGWAVSAGMVPDAAFVLVEPDGHVPPPFLLQQRLA